MIDKWKLTRAETEQMKNIFNRWNPQPKKEIAHVVKPVWCGAGRTLILRFRNPLPRFHGLLLPLG